MVALIAEFLLIRTAAAADESDMTRLRLLLVFGLLVMTAGVGEAKFHLFKKHAPRTAPGGQVLTHYKAPKVQKHKPHTRTNPGY